MNDEALPYTADEAPPSVVVGPGRALQVRMSRAFQGVAARAAAITAYLFLAGAAYDLGILWIVQRQGSPEWEFGALTVTVETLPRFVLAIALLYIARSLRGSTSLIGYRLMAVFLLAIGLIGAAAAGLAVTDFFILRRSVEPAALAIFTSTTVKTVGMGVLHALLLVPLGVSGLRRP
jgi:hypothetical protein